MARPIREECPFCGWVWQTIITVFGKPCLVHHCTERKAVVGWYNDKDSVPFVVPESQMGGGAGW